MLLSFLLLFLHQVLSQSYCGSYLPKDESTCDKYTNTTFICCHLTGHVFGTVQSMCYPFSREDYYKMSRSISINNYDFKLKCGSTRGAFCGQIVNPITYKDCSIYSKKDNSCCYYKYQKQTNCVWLGKPDVGTMKYKDLLVICEGSYTKINLYTIVLILFMSIL